MNDNVNLRSIQARKARLGRRIGKTGEQLAWVLGAALGGFAAFLFVETNFRRAAFAASTIALACVISALWHREDLAKPGSPPPPGANLDVLLSPSVLAELRAPLSPRSLWNAIRFDWQASFVYHHVLLNQEEIARLLPAESQALADIWQQARGLREHYRSPRIDAATIAAAILTVAPELKDHLAKNKISEEDIFEAYSWLERHDAFFNRRPRLHFGGLGRDWTSGFTPTLDRFGENVSNAIQSAGGFAPFVLHGDTLSGIITSLENGNGVALVGDVGTGKTWLVDALANKLLEDADGKLQFYQIISLDASAIISATDGHIERLMLTLFHEAAAAGNTILFLDDAQLFFGNGVGAFDMSQLLRPALEAHRLKIIAAFTPNEWQQLRLHDPSLANGFSAVNIQAADETATLKVLEDEATQLESRHKLLITLRALHETYRLSGQYMQEDAYPGKAVSLLRETAPHASGNLVTEVTVQTTLEQLLGVRVSAAAAPEAAALLHLEDQIHTRMINQTRAVSVVADALRRGRAGVGNPKRPVGSFLFLGPTGVGKTELARSLAAVYFGSEQQMIRLDMSEYQQPEDVLRLLSGGGRDEQSLLQAIRKQPFSVVLLDEVEKAHPNILNLLLQMLDEGHLTDEHGKPASFRSAIIIATSNAGSADIAAQVAAGGSLDTFERPLIDKLIKEGQFKPELINRFDEVVLFRPLTESELAQVALLMLGEVNRTLAAQNIKVALTPEALAHITHEGYDPQFGARPMRRVIQKTVENAVAIKILSKQTSPGSTITLDVADLGTGETQQPGR